MCINIFLPLCTRITLTTHTTNTAGPNTNPWGTPFFISFPAVLTFFSFVVAAGHGPAGQHRHDAGAGGERGGRGDGARAQPRGHGPGARHLRQGNLSRGGALVGRRAQRLPEEQGGLDWLLCMGSFIVTIIGSHN